MIFAMPANRLRNPPVEDELDRIDFELLDLLQNDAWLSNKELAAKVGLAPSSCHARVRRLKESGVLKSAHARVDRKALGIELEAMVSVRLQTHARSGFEQLRDHLLARPEVIAVYQTAGTEDFLVLVATKSSDHLRDFVMDELADRPEVVHLETNLLFAVHRKMVLPSYAAESLGESAGHPR